jgi:hypothetical protein
MTAESPPTSPRVAEFVEHLRAEPPEPPPPTRRSLSWLLKRVAVAAGLALGIFLAFGIYMVTNICACTPRPDYPDSPVVGVVVDVTPSGPGEVSRFQLRVAGNRTLSFSIGDTDSAVEFPPTQLGLHEANGNPVRVYFTVIDDGWGAVAYRLQTAIE